MKKLIVAAALAAISSGAFAADGETPAQAKEGQEAAAPAAAAEVRRGRPAARPFDRAAFEARMKKRAEERRGKVAEVLKSAGVPADKVDATAEEIDKLYARRPSHRMHRQGKPDGVSKRPPRMLPKEAPAQPQESSAQK